MIPYMIIYDKFGKLQHINKLDYINDKLYYMNIMQSKFNVTQKKENKNRYPVEDKLVRLVNGTNN